MSFGRDAAIADQLAWRTEWYDHWLKGIDNTVGKAAPFATPVRIFVMGTGDGGKDDRRAAEPRRLLARRAGVAAGSRRYRPTTICSRDGRLSTATPPEATATTQFQFDPHHPVPTIGGNISSGNDILLQGAWDQRGGPHVWNFHEPMPLSARNDVLVFQTEPLAEDLEVTGEIAVRLFASVAPSIPTSRPS